MSTTITHPTSSPHTHPTDRTSSRRRFFGVVGPAQTARHIGYLLLGLPLGIIWFTVLVTGLSVGVGVLVVALAGIPVLLGMGYLTRGFANAERVVANMLLAQHLRPAPLASTARGNLWVRLRAMAADGDRWRELGFLLLRLPVGVATFTAAVTALAAPVAVAYAPVHVRYVGDRSFGEWEYSSTLEDAASTPWSWLLVPLGALLLIASLHLMNALAAACARWTSARLDLEQDS